MTARNNIWYLALTFKCFLQICIAFMKRSIEIAKEMYNIFFSFKVSSEWCNCFCFVVFSCFRSCMPRYSKELNGHFLRFALYKKCLLNDHHHLWCRWFEMLRLLQPQLLNPGLRSSRFTAGILTLPETNHECRHMKSISTRTLWTTPWTEYCSVVFHFIH